MSTKVLPPPGGDIDNGWKLEVGTTVTFLVASIVVALRCFTRWKYSRKGWDDYLMVFALLLAFVATVVDFVAVNDGLGRHLFYLSYKQSVDQQYYSLLAQVFCVHALGFAKLSITVSYMRLLRGSGSRIHEVLLWTVGASVFIVNTIVVVVFYAACSPTEKSWNPRVKGTCWQPHKKLAFLILQGAYSGFTDFLLAIYPFFFLSKLQLKSRTKVLVLLLMGLGTVTGVFAIIRTVETGTQLHLPPNAAPDISFTTVLGLTWSGLERNIAILIGSIPALNPLARPVTRYVRALGSSGSRTKSAGSQSNQLSEAPIQPKQSNDTEMQHVPSQ